MRQIERLLHLVGQPIEVASGEPEPRELHNWDIVAPAMLFSAGNSLLSIRHLANASTPRREQDASVLLRRLYEHAVDFAWIAINPAVNAHRWVADDYYHRLKMDSDFTRIGRGALSTEKRQQYQDYIDSNGRLPELLPRIEEAETYWSARIKEHLPFPNAGLIGQQVECTKLVPWSLRVAYASVYRLGSANAHPTPMGVCDYIKSGGVPGRFHIQVKPNSFQSRYAYTMAPPVFGSLLHVASCTLGRPASSEITAALMSETLMLAESTGQ